MLVDEAAVNVPLARGCKITRRRVKCLQCKCIVSVRSKRQKGPVALVDRPMSGKALDHEGSGTLLVERLNGRTALSASGKGAA